MRLDIIPSKEQSKNLFFETVLALDVNTTIY